MAINFSRNHPPPPWRTHRDLHRKFVPILLHPNFFLETRICWDWSRGADIFCKRFLSSLEFSLPSAQPRGLLPYKEVREGALVPKFASEIHVRDPNFASKNIGDKCPKFCPLNFRYDPKIRILSQLLRLVSELPKFFFLFGELGWTLP